MQRVTTTLALLAARAIVSKTHYISQYDFFIRVLIMTLHTANAVLHFWFHVATPTQWFTKDAHFDQIIRTRFLATTQAAAQGECAHWRYSLYGRLAEIIVLDQFSRNIWRDTPQAFSQDPMALALAQEAIRQPAFATLNIDQKKFMLMPFMHSESRAIHAQAEPLFRMHTDENTLHYEQLHKNIIDRFGRYPHRNAILNRPSTPEEKQFLLEPNSSF